MNLARLALWLRVAFALALLSGGYTFLEWNNSEPAQQQTGGDSLVLTLDAPVVSQRGPWQLGHSFTHRDLGIPLDVAPSWNVAATYAADGIEASDGTWSATVVLRQVGPGGRAWWSQEAPLQVEADGNTAAITFPAEQWGAEAESLSKEAATPGRLEVMLIVIFSTTVETEDGAVPITRSARVVTQPQDELAVVEVHNDHGTYSAAVPRPTPLAPVGLGAAAAAAGVAALAVRRRLPSHAALHEVHVKGLRVPETAAETTYAELCEAAARIDTPLFIDAAAGHACMSGPLPLFARIESHQPDVEP